jgi:hypothetical protein
VTEPHVVTCELVPIERAARWGYRAFRIAARIAELVAEDL